MDQRRFSLVPDSKVSDKETDFEDKPSSKAGEMGFYDTVASGQASVSNWRAFPVSMGDPPSDDLLEKGEEPGEESTHVTRSLTTPQVKLPLILNTAVIANSSSN